MTSCMRPHRASDNPPVPIACTLPAVSPYLLHLAVGRLLRPPGGRVLKVLLPAIGRRVKEAVGVGEPFGAAGVGRVGMENVVVEAEEDAQAVLFTLQKIGSRSGLHLRPVPIVVLDGGHGLVQRDMEVIVELAAKGGVPGEAPPLEPLVRLKL